MNLAQPYVDQLTVGSVALLHMAATSPEGINLPTATARLRTAKNNTARDAEFLKDHDFLHPRFSRKEPYRITHPGRQSLRNIFAKWKIGDPVSREIIEATPPLCRLGIFRTFADRGRDITFHAFQCHANTGQSAALLTRWRRAKLATIIGEQTYITKSGHTASTPVYQIEKEPWFLLRQINFGVFHMEQKPLADLKN